ncbi:hypothetical protein LA6_003422 [Marinibacterium anthonyi]|nr:hypothetical protein LA6_003422 [Marinibacterium anthonyi]
MGRQGEPGVTLDLNFLKDLTGVLAFAISVISMIYAVVGNRRKDIERRFHEGSKRMDRHDLRLQELAQTVQGMPGKDDMHRLELQLSEIAGDMKAMSATMLGMSQSMARTEKIVGRHEDHLMGDRS